MSHAPGRRVQSTRQREPDSWTRSANSVRTRPAPPEGGSGEGTAGYVTAFRRVFRAPVYTGRRGRPRLVLAAGSELIAARHPVVPVLNHLAGVVIHGYAFQLGQGDGEGAAIPAGEDEHLVLSKRPLVKLTPQELNTLYGQKVAEDALE